MTDSLIQRCEPSFEFRELPYHWVQWRTPYRCEEPEPWAWNMKEQLWRANGGTEYSPERASQLQWHYLGPAHMPAVPHVTETDDEYYRLVNHLAKMVAASHFAIRFQKSLDDPLVQAAADDQ